MDYLKKLAPLFTAGIFFIGFLSLLLVGFNAMLGPIKKDIAKLEAGQVRLEREIKTELSHIRKLLNKLNSDARQSPAPASL